MKEKNKKIWNNLNKLERANVGDRLRLKNSKRTSKRQVFFSTEPEKPKGALFGPKAQV